MITEHTRWAIFWEHHKASELCHRLDLKHAWHDGPSGKVAIEELIVDGHVLIAHRILAGLKFGDSIHQEKWVPAHKVKGPLGN
jgi:hypothetical protein